MGDQLAFKIKDLTEKNTTYAREFEINERNMNMLVSERDQFRDETKELLATKKRLEAEARVNDITAKEKISRQEILLKQK